tara:strand:- start:31140 stop:31637 length:498 start_codon:yes stop_codon:yes gene_type:complete
MNIQLREMEYRLLKLATRKLLGRFKNLEEAAGQCRVKPTNLSQYQSFDHSAFMPVDVAMELERVIGEPILTRELANLHEQRGWPEHMLDVRGEALDIPVAVGELLAFICEATAENSPGGRRLTENEKRRYFELRRNVSEELRQLDTAVEQDSDIKNFRQVGQKSA